MTNDRADALGDETVDVVVYGRAADRYITLHYDSRRFRDVASNPVFCALVAWNNGAPVVQTKRRFMPVHVRASK